MTRTVRASLSGREVPAAALLAVLLAVAGLSAGAAAGTRPPAPLAIDARSATAAEFALVHGVGPVVGSRLVAARDENGPWRTRSELLAVPGVGPALFSDLSRHLAFPDDAGR